MKWLLIAKLLISFLLLNVGFIGKPKLQALYCADERDLTTKSFEDNWKDYAWIYDVKIGKLYEY